MASPLVRRQIPLPVGSTTSQTPPPQTTPSPAVPSTTTPNGSLPPTSSVSSTVTSLRSSVSSSTSSVAHSSSSSTSVPPSSITSSSSVSLLTPTETPLLPTSEPDGPATITQTSSAAGPPPSEVPVTKAKGFLENKPLSGFVFGLAGLVFLVIVFIVITSFVRRRNRKRLLTDAEKFSFDPKDVEDGASEEKYSQSGLVSQHNVGHGHNDFPLDDRVNVGVLGPGAGSVSRPAPARSPPMPKYVPQDYGGYDGGHTNQYHNLGNVPVGYNPTPNPYDMYGPRNGGGYPNGWVQHDPYSLPSPNGESFSNTDPGYSVPRPLQPGVRSAQGQTFAPHPSANNQLNHSPLISPTTSPPPPSYLQPSLSDKIDIARLPTPSFPPATRSSVDSLDGAYGGAFLGPDSPPEQRTLQVANM